MEVGLKLKIVGEVRYLVRQLIASLVRMPQNPRPSGFKAGILLQSRGPFLGSWIYSTNGDTFLCRERFWVLGSVHRRDSKSPDFMEGLLE